MKKQHICAGLIFTALLVTLTGCTGASSVEVGQGSQAQPAYGAAISTGEKKSAVDEAPSVTITLTPEQVYTGTLLLVNTTHPVRKQGVREDVVRLADHRELVQGFGLLDNGIEASQLVMGQFQRMTKAAARAGVRHFLISSGFRDVAEQAKLYRQMGAKYALPPGQSEHNLGLSLDIGSSLQAMSQAPEGKWLVQHAAEFGFVLRYPKDKIKVTGIAYEPWHFRYVGLPHSMIMQEHGWTLEEYLQTLRAKSQLQGSVQGQSYLIQYRAVKKVQTLEVPQGKKYDISGDNAAGVIVTQYP